ncbi:MAG TPA: hypothetical protein VEL07_12780 [Planctomycetota bacterium]|nr:hypothetical protein [Planctomycetota bacterium]
MHGLVAPCNARSCFMLALPADGDGWSADRRRLASALAHATSAVSNMPRLAR